MRLIKLSFGIILLSYDKDSASIYDIAITNRVDIDIVRLT